MARLTASEFADKWARRTQGATEDYERGVRAVTEAPGLKAAAAADRYAAGVAEAVASGKFQDRVGAVSLGDWQNKAISKGKGRIAAGVTEAKSDVQQFAGELLQHIDSGQTILDQNPRGDFEANIQRMVGWSRHMKQFSRSAR